MLMLGFGIALVTKIGTDEFLGTMQLPGDLPKLINSGACRRKVLLQLFSENDDNARPDGQCCDVYINQDIASTDDFKEELKVLINALETVGSKGEVKVAEWIRGSALSWTEKHDKSSLSYGNHYGHGIDFWRKFMRQCHVLGLVNYEL